MDLLHTAIDFILHINVHLGELIERYHDLTYAILFAIVFCETGLVITPFLPGDSLLFAAGAFAAPLADGTPGPFRLWLLFAVFLSAALLGDNLNYWVGRRLGRGLMQRFPRLVKPKHVARTEQFYARHGGKTVVLARFVPIVRTFAPFVAGLGNMPYWRFLSFSVLGALAWVGGCTGAGYFFGARPWVQENFSVVVLAIIGISVLPVLIELWRARSAGKQAA